MPLSSQISSRRQVPFCAILVRDFLGQENKEGGP